MEKSYYVQLDELFGNWIKEYEDKINVSGFCKDGIMLKAYKTEKSIDTLWDESLRRVMFVLKDKNTPDGDDTRLWFLDRVHGEEVRNLSGGNVGKTGFLPNIARMLYGLTVETVGYDQLDMNKVKEAWNTIPFAFMEAKKTAGKSYVTNEEMLAALEKGDGELLMKEIEILNPTIIVCCDAEDSQFDYITKKFKGMEHDEIITIDYEYPYKPHFNCHLQYYPTLNKAVIKSYHPTRAGKAGDWVIYERVISPFRQLLNNDQIKLK